MNQITRGEKQQTIDLNSPYTRRMAQQAVLIDATISHIDNEYMYGRLNFKENRVLHERTDVLCKYFDDEVKKVHKGIKNEVMGRSKASEKRIVIVNTPYTGKISQTTKRLDQLMRNIDRAAGFNRLDQNKEIALRRKINSFCEHVESEVKAIRRLSNKKRQHSQGSHQTVKPNNKPHTISANSTSTSTSTPKEKINVPTVKADAPPKKEPHKQTVKKKTAKKKTVSKKLSGKNPDEKAA